MLFNKPEYKTISFKGLNIIKHRKNLNTLREEGWIPVATKPDTENMQMIYRLRKVNGWKNERYPI